MTGMAGAHGLAGWQWMFLVEGLPCVLLGVLALKLLADKPADAKWLNEDEKRMLFNEINILRELVGLLYITLFSLFFFKIFNILYIYSYFTYPSYPQP